MTPSVEDLEKIAGVRPGAARIGSNIQSVIEGLKTKGASAGLLEPHRLAHYLAQLAHESGGFRYDKEVWGPTPAQLRYDTRTDLGNTPAKDGDGEKYKGRGPIQITGRTNVEAFRDWCRGQGLSPPDFVAYPDLINTDPWEGLGPIWYWSTRGLNRYADENNIEQITKRINGGLNGYTDRVRYYVRAALVLLGYGPEDIRVFQLDAQKKRLLPPDKPGQPQIDGDAGPKTRSALHKALAALGGKMTEVAASPVVEEKPVAMTPKNAEKTGMTRVTGAIAAGSPILGLFAGFNQTGVLIMVGIGIAAVVVLLWRGELIAARARKVLKEFGGDE